MTLLAGVALATTGAAPVEEQKMLDAFDAVLTAMAYAASGLCVFAIVWAGFILMAEGAPRSGAGAGQRPPSSWRWSASSWCSRPRASPPCWASGLVPSFPTP